MNDKVCIERDGVFLGYCKTCKLIGGISMNTLHFKYAELRGRIVAKYRTIEAFAKELDRSVVSVSRKLNCKSEFSQKDIILWSRLLEIPEADIGIYFFN